MLNYRNLEEYGCTGFLNRSARLDNIESGDVEFLKGKNISTIIDLRCHSKWKKTNQLGHDDFFVTYNLGLDIHLYFKNNDLNNVPEEYLNIASQENIIRDTLKCISFSKGNVLLYCSWGKDRTGVVIALILMIAGVSKANIVHDYVKSERELIGNLEEERNPKIPEYALHAYELYMQKFLELFENKYQSIDKYCEKIEVGREELISIKKKVIS